MTCCNDSSVKVPPGINIAQFNAFHHSSCSEAFVNEFCNSFHYRVDQVVRGWSHLEC